MTDGPAIDIIDVLGRASFEQLPLCADARFDHRSCDYWEDAVRGAKASRPSWWQPGDAPPQLPRTASVSDNPFAPPVPEPTFNPFARGGSPPTDDNPFAPAPPARARTAEGPRKLGLLERGQGVFGSYAKVLLLDGVPGVYAQFGPLSAYPRARHVRELYPRLPSSPLPAVITCIASSLAAQAAGHARHLVRVVCDDLAARGFSAVEAYPDLTLAHPERSAADPDFWRTCGFTLAVDDERFPVMRRESADRDGMTFTTPRLVRAPRGSAMSCRGWQQEAALRMLMNNLDPDVAEDPDHLVVYGGTGRAARSWEAFEAICRELRALGDDETLLVQSGKPVAVFRTHEWAPRVLIANSNLVGRWATWEQFRELERQGLTMYGQMTAGSWIYIGSQGILQGTYETFAELARQHFGGTLRGRVVLTAGLGGMGGAQPLAVTMNDGVALCIEVDPERAERRLRAGYVDRLTTSLDEALTEVRAAASGGSPLSVALIGNASELEPELVRRGEGFDAVTDQTSAHDALNGYVPASLELPAAVTLRSSDPDAYVGRSMASMADHVRAMLALQAAGAVTFDYGNNIRAQAQAAGVSNAFDFPGFVPAFIRPLFCEGRGPFRWVALSGDPEDIARTDEAVLELFPTDTGLRRWLAMARDRVPFQGLPARICWLGYGERARAGLAFNELVRKGVLRGPIVIGRDHLDAGSVASPNRETEAMLDGSDAIADWPLLNALVNTSAGATWVSIHHGGGTGIGYSQHAGMVVVADGTELAAQKLERVLTTDPGMGVVRHADAGYPRAIDVARERGLHIPMLEG